MEPAEAIQQLDLVVARVSAADAHPGARGHSAVLRLDLGGRGSREASVPLALEAARTLVGTQVVCAVGGEDAVVLAAHPRDGEIVLLRPAGEVEDGAPVA